MPDFEGFDKQTPEGWRDPVEASPLDRPEHAGGTFTGQTESASDEAAPVVGGIGQQPEDFSGHDSALPNPTTRPGAYPPLVAAPVPETDTPDPETEPVESRQPQADAWDTRLPRTVNLNVRGVGEGSTVIGAVDGPVNFDFRGELLRHSKIPVDDLEGTARDRFVPPAGIEDIEESLVLGTRRVALLTIEAGGRDTTARYLASAGKVQTPRGIDPPPSLRIESWQLKECPKSGWLLDLTGVKIENPKQVLRQLAGLRDALEQQESFLIVVFGERDLDPSLRRELGVIELKRPNPYAVLKRQLFSEPKSRESESETVSTAACEEWVKFAQNRHLLDRKPPAEALRLARTITEATDHWDGLDSTEREALKDELHNANAARSEDDADYVRYLVLKQFQTWEPELDAWNRQIKDKPRLRTFQLAIAVVPSGDPVTIRTESTALLGHIIKRHRKITGITDTSGPAAEGALNGPGTRQLAIDSMAELRDGKVAFTRPGFDEAVVRYFWDDWPEFRGELIDWLMDLATASTFSDEEQKKLKERIGTYAIHHAQERGEFNFLYDVIAKWAESEGTLTDASTLLEEAANAPGISRRVRDRTLDWAKNGNLALKRAVAALCARSSFATSHPTLAVKRLSSLMENRTADQDDPPLENALQTACRLLVTEADQTSTVLGWLDKDLRSEQVEHRRRAALLFLPIAGARSDDAAPPALIAQSQASSELREATVRSWGTILRLVSTVKTNPERYLGLDQVQPVYNAWVNACEPEAVETQVTDLFRDAVCFDPDEAGDAAQHGAVLTYRWHEHAPLPSHRTEAIHRRLHTAFSEGSGQAMAQSHDATRQEGT